MTSTKFVDSKKFSSTPLKFELIKPINPGIEKKSATAMLRVRLLETDVISDRVEFAIPILTKPANIKTIAACVNPDPGNRVIHSINSKNFIK